MAKHTPESLVLYGTFLIGGGSLMIIRSLRTYYSSQTVEAVVVKTVSAQGFFKVFLEWKDDQGGCQSGVVTVTDADLPTKGTVMKVVPSRGKAGELQVPRMKYLLGPGALMILVGAIILYGGLAESDTIK